MVVPDVDNAYCDFAAVSELTFEEPSDSLNVAGNNLIARGIDIGAEDFTESLTGATNSYTVGTPIEGGVAFDLNPAVHDGELKAVCIGDVSSESDALCAELDSLGGGVAFKDFYNEGGNHRLEIAEFPYSDDLWNELNTNQNGALNASVVGGAELDNWAESNCS